jgi:hypothetical protein
LTPHEFRVMHAGFFRREDRAWEKVATLGLWVLAPYTKEKLTPTTLLGRTALVTLPPTGAQGALDEEALIEAQKAAALARAVKWAQE